MTTLDKDLKESREEMRSTTAAHTILINRIIKKGEFDFSDVPTEEEVEKKLKESQQ